MNPFFLLSLINSHFFQKKQISHPIFGFDPDFAFFIKMQKNKEIT